jgi:hypothetical protein
MYQPVYYQCGAVRLHSACLRPPLTRDLADNGAYFYYVSVLRTCPYCNMALHLDLLAFPFPHTTDIYCRGGTRRLKFRTTSRHWKGCTSIPSLRGSHTNTFF